MIKRHILAPVILLLLSLSACGQSATQATAQNSDQLGESSLSSGDKHAKVMCMWNAYGKQQYLCTEPPIDEAQKKCDEKATQDRGEDAKCSCTRDKNYIQDMCDDGSDPPVNDYRRRRD